MTWVALLCKPNWTIAASMRGAFTLWTLVALVVGNAVGAGIYTTSGFALADLGSRQWVMLAWFVGGLVALMGAVSYGMLVRRLTESGGEYLFLSRSIHPIAGFIAGWISLLAGFPGAIAFAASAMETYARSAIPELSSIPLDALAVLTIITAGLVHLFRVSFGARVHEWIVNLLLFLMLCVVIVAAFMFSQSSTLPTPDDQAIAGFSTLAFANSLVWISLSYSGFNAAAYVAGEVANAQRIVPKGMVIGTLITLGLCLVVNAIILYGADPGELRGQADIATTAATNIGGAGAKWLVQWLIVISLLTSITAMVLAGPRVYAKMAEDGALPAMFRARAGEPPRASIILQVATAIVLVLIADLRDLLSYLGLTLSLCLALAVSSLFVRHWRFGEVPDSFWYPVAPVLFVGATLLFAVLSAINQPAQFLAAVPTLLIGGLVYCISWWWQHRRRIA